MGPVCRNQELTGKAVVRKETSQKSGQNSQPGPRKIPDVGQCWPDPKDLLLRAGREPSKEPHSKGISWSIPASTERRVNGRKGLKQREVSRGGPSLPMKMPTLGPMGPIPHFLGPLLPTVSQRRHALQSGPGTHDPSCALVCSCLQKWLHSLSMSPQLTPGERGAGPHRLGGEDGLHDLGPHCTSCC